MEKLTLDQYATEAGVGEKNTVSSGPDNGANNNIAARFWNCNRHGSTQQAFDFAVRFAQAGKQQEDVVSLSAGGMNIGGHGNEGLLTTGQGQNGPFDPAKIMYIYNEYNWGPQLDRVKPTAITMISIWSCHTGAGADGAEFLYRMALRCGRAVRAGTGFLYSNSSSMWWENGSVWQVATPNNKPAPIAPPSAHFVGDEMAMFEVDGGEMSVSDLVSIEIERFVFDRSAGASKSASGEGAVEIAGKLFSSIPLDMKGVANSGLVTAVITLTFKSKNSIVLDVYNDRLAIEREGLTGYYLNAQLRTLFDLMK
ncbi:MAG: hypothetical protein KDK08_09790 [Rhizobiaceae bacterium]|nr:hypothetical protein [Rhizobiaceae bacterium]